MSHEIRFQCKMFKFITITKNKLYMGKKMHICCLLRVHFQTFDLAGPVTGIGTVATITDDNGLLNLADSIGDCVIG